MPSVFPYWDMLGHRGLSHSLLVAVVLGVLVTAVVRRTLPESPGPAKLWLFFFVATASHGLLDAMTNAGPSTSSSATAACG